ncbi:hypothetical protein RB195_005825 [Necator americanus]|uniref:DH domain-containing protein n=1 Tax=Necator americanus TaxID=51031 RepID=A0ABR1BTJ6_NECAM
MSVVSSCIPTSPFLRLIQERKVFEDLFNESERRNRTLGVRLMRVADDLHALRRIMPLAAKEKNSVVLATGR